MLAVATAMLNAQSLVHGKSDSYTLPKGAASDDIRLEGSFELLP